MITEYDEKFDIKNYCYFAVLLPIVLFYQHVKNGIIAGNYENHVKNGMNFGVPVKDGYINLKIMIFPDENLSDVPDDATDILWFETSNRVFNSNFAKIYG